MLVGTITATYGGSILKVASKNLLDDVDRYLEYSGKKGGGGSSKYSLKTVGDNRRANEIARQLGYDGAEDLKAAFVNKTNVSRYNMMYDTKTSEIILQGVKNSKELIPTGLFMP